MLLMTQAERDLCECLRRVRNGPDFKPFRDWLAETTADTVAVLLGSNDDRVMHQAQGALRQLKKLTDFIEAAPGLLEKGR